jgi:serine/threonine protein kinase
MTTPTRIKYDKEKILGRGGFGTVYEGSFFDGNQNRKVAVKRVEMREEDQEYMNNLKKEEEALNKLHNHPYIVQLYFVEVQQEEFR